MTWDRSLVSWLAAAVLALGVSWSGVATAQDLDLEFEMAGKAKLSAKGVGKLGIPVALGIVMGGSTSSGTWTAVDHDGEVFQGSYLAQGASGRKFSVQFDSASLETLASVLEDHVFDETGLVAEVLSISQRPAVVAFNKKRTKAKLKLVFELTAEVEGVIRTAKYKLPLKTVVYER